MPTAKRTAISHGIPGWFVPPPSKVGVVVLFSSWGLKGEKGINILGVVL